MILVGPAPEAPIEESQFNVKLNVSALLRLTPAALSHLTAATRNSSRGVADSSTSVPEQVVKSSAVPPSIWPQSLLSPPSMRPSSRNSIGGNGFGLMVLHLRGLRAITVIASGSRTCATGTAASSRQICIYALRGRSRIEAIGQKVHAARVRTGGTRAHEGGHTGDRYGRILWGRHLATP